MTWTICPGKVGALATVKFRCKPTKGINRPSGTTRRSTFLEKQGNSSKEAPEAVPPSRTGLRRSARQEIVLVGFLYSSQQYLKKENNEFYFRIAIANSRLKFERLSTH